MSLGQYEIHITVSTDESGPASEVAKMLSWKTSEIARDPILGDKNYFYLTKYANTIDAAHEKVVEAVRMLGSHGVTVIREKIEHIVHDIRYTR